MAVRWGWDPWECILTTWAVQWDITVLRTEDRMVDPTEDQCMECHLMEWDTDQDMDHPITDWDLMDPWDPEDLKVHQCEE